MSSTSQPILLSQPRTTLEDEFAVLSALRSGWLAPTGPALDNFERNISSYLGVGSAVGLSSGSAALHLALQYVGVRPGDFVIVPTVTFAATAFAATYLGATPVFVDIESEGWGLDPDCTEEAIASLRARGCRIGAAIPVDLYGSPVSYERIEPILDDAGIPLIEDAAEALGGRFNGRKLGTFGRAGVLSFNGNKIITTSGGGMLVTDDDQMAARVRKWATQSREATPWYEHEEVGYNYRLSNVLAALGQSQLERLEAEVARRRTLRNLYRQRLGHLSSVTVQDDPPWGRSNAWLTVIQISQSRFADWPKVIRERLKSENIEARPVWKPLHLQPVFRANLAFLNGNAERLFAEGLCLPSGARVDTYDVDRICSHIERTLGEQSSE